MVLLPGMAIGGVLAYMGRGRNARPMLAGARWVAQRNNIASAHRPHRRNRLVNAQNPHEHDVLLERIGGTSIRHLSTNTEPIARRAEGMNWVPVYRFEGIRVGALLARAKLVQTVFSAMLLPYTAYQYSIDAMSYNWFMCSTGAAITAPIALLIFSRYFNRLIGVIAMTENEQFVRIGFLSFWGSRRNRLLELEDAIPLSEVRDVTKSKDALVKFMQYSREDFLYLPTRNVEITDREKAELLFGSLEYFVEADADEDAHKKKTE
ncbi:hypothetical protein L596_011062 [Steinernema carpocapsae]|uniref:Transmembrane protein 186 n=1 Tax=Steinernema carpocapsae TaxID=34508 RepID=A0A4U5NTK8_STECR|nr:hypothetical protein L596_011062 [Steinernema carpocapsae]